MKITIDLLKYFGILLYNAPCIRLSAMSTINNYFFRHIYHLKYCMFKDKKMLYLSINQLKNSIVYNKCTI